MKQNISITRARTKRFKLYVTDASGSNRTLSTGERLIFGVKKNVSDVEYKILKKTDGETPDIIYDDVLSAYIIVFNPTDTNECSPGDYVYDVGLQNGTNYYPIIETSTFTILPNVTEREDS